MLKDCSCSFTDLSVYFANNASSIEVYWDGSLLLWQQIPYKGSFFYLFLLLFYFCYYYISYYKLQKFIKLLLSLLLKLSLLLFCLYIIFNFKFTAY